MAELDDFLDEMTPVFNTRMSATGPGRSRVVMAQYIRDAQALLVEYQGGATWKYAPVSPQEAEAFYKAPSWGVFIWDRFRVRGTVHEHQIDARRVK